MHTVLTTGAAIIGGIALPLGEGGAPRNAVSPGESALRDDIGATDPGLIGAAR